ncbi:hypothetical protein TRAPUB_6658 [Trametes pubescens]|uniref:Uncharacterized protein n=1 Tax=Trametes pubescens TaxID=154538 RepID=A0A1M2V5B7_TRAPU|nr:hypothetical protein TRAPUB_6658 [Trametes pubescens]
MSEDVEECEEEVGEKRRASGHDHLILAMSYVILGRAIKNEYLALGTIFGTVGATLLATGGKKEPAPAAKPTLQQIKETVKVNASSSEEEDLMNSIKNFIAEAEKESKH